ncbi:MAG: hypothetical protein AAF548_03005 [Actinomycetota bacterium]
MTGQRSERSVAAASLEVVLCSGSDCAKDERKAYRALAARLESSGVDVVRSTCLGVCHGPVVVAADAEGRAVVVGKIRSDRRRSEVAEAIVAGRLGRVRKAGVAVSKAKRRARAMRRAGRALGRELTPR